MNESKNENIIMIFQTAFFLLCSLLGQTIQINIVRKSPFSERQILNLQETLTFYHKTTLELIISLNRGVFRWHQLKEKLKRHDPDVSLSFPQIQNILKIKFTRQKNI